MRIPIAALIVAPLAVLAFVVASPAAQGQEKPIELFNGKDLTGWTFFLTEKGKMEDVWSVKDGVLNCKGTPIGYIRTEKDYTSFKLTLEWRSPGKPGNSGVLMRLQPPDKVWPRSIEAQLQSKSAGDIWNIDDFPMKTASDRTQGRHTVKAHETNEKPLGEWNKYEITLDGTDLELKVNGLVQNVATDCKVMPGKIALQSEGAEIEFRNILLTPLPDKSDKKAESTPTADGVAKRTLAGLDGWHITGNGNWTIADGVIEGKQAEAEKSYTHVVSDKSYGNFKASLKFRAVKGNSGFYFRVKQDEQGRMHGFQAEIDETRDAGGIYESYGRNWIVNPDDEFVKTYFKPQEWNEMTVEARGPHVVVSVNGTKVSDINDSAVRMEGPVALQIHGGQHVHVMFKDIRIEALSN
ncbi:MAG: DUF1080 domain-containing protein [Tepidisphaeraceae bacterium]